MAKKIKVQLYDKDKLIFELKDDAKKGDLIDLKAIDQVDLSIIINKINEKEKEYLKQLFDQNKDSLLAQFKNQNWYKEQEKDLIKLETQLKQKDTELENAVKNKDSELRLEYQKQNLEFQNKINILENELEALKASKEKDVEISILKATKELEEEISNLKREKDSHNIKQLGEDLEKWILREAETNLKFSSNIRFEKANENIQGTKPDFLFKILDANNDIVETVTIEAKTEYTELSVNKQKNDAHYEKLDKDRIKNNSEYSILVTELELDDKSFIFKRINEYKNMFVVRPAYLIPLLRLIESISEQKAKIQEKQGIEFKEKQKILEEFNEMKNDILNNSIKNINNKLETINLNAQKINDLSKKILDDIQMILERHFKTVKNKLETFRIEKLIDKK